MINPPIAKKAAYRRACWGEPSVTKFIAISNRRGGVGKTTVMMMLAYGLSVARRQKVLLVDLDAQASTSTIMMGHQRWCPAREARLTTSGLLRYIVTDEVTCCTDFVSQRIGDVVTAGWQSASPRHRTERSRPRRERGAADDCAASAFPQNQ